MNIKFAAFSVSEKSINTTCHKSIHPVEYVVFLVYTPANLYCKFAFRAHFQCVNARKDHEYSYEMGSVSALTNQILYLETWILKCIDSVIGKSTDKPKALKRVSIYNIDMLF